MSDRSQTSSTLADARGPRPAKLAVRDLVKTRRVHVRARPSPPSTTSRSRCTPGEFVCLLGPSGCGKTTILNILAGLDAPTSGQALLDGRPIAGPGPDRAVLFQEPALFPWLSVVANVEFALRFVGVAAGGPPRPRDGSGSRTSASRSSRNAQPHELSAGSGSAPRWRAPSPAIPTCCWRDEPFGALDAQARELLQNELQRVWVESQGHEDVRVRHPQRPRGGAARRSRDRDDARRPGRLLEEQRIGAPRPRDLDDVLVAAGRLGDPRPR